MKKLILLMLLSLSANASFNDKQKHILATTAISATATAYARYQGATPLEAWFVGVGSGLLVGIAKEYYDKNHSGVEDMEDIYADTKGAILGSILAFSFEYKF